MSDVNNVIKNVLVSGAGGDIGIAIGRILIDEKINGVYGCDISTDNAGACVFEEIIEVPRANDSEYFTKLKKIFEDYNIELFIPSSEAEIAVITELGLPDNKLFGIPMVILDSTTVLTALDKYKTAKSLVESDIDAPWTLTAADNGPLEYPCIYKPRSGQGSKGIKIIKSETERLALDVGQNHIWQELLLPNDEEYTCGIFRTKECYRAITFKRTLYGGFTGKGEVVSNPVIERYLEQIANALNVHGAANFQLRLTPAGPKLFEINPRFSSTVMFRHLLGFKDVIWAIEDALSLPISDYTEAKSGTKFYRGYCEYIQE